MDENRRQGQRAGIRWAIAWLHQHADEMNDPSARLLLNAAAFQMSVAAKRFRIDDETTPADIANPEE